MSNFNYQKAYCTQAVPAFLNLPEHVRKAHADLLPLVMELQQNKLLLIPLNDGIRAIFDKLTTKEIAELSRASYFVGHWQPSVLTPLFESRHGESWKVSNCADQILRERLNPPKKIQVHEGKLRVTFSSPSCWLWEEFALATEDNLQTFVDCGLPFGESTLHESAGKLAEQIGDLWPDVDSVEENDLYREYVRLSTKQLDDKNLAKVAALIPDAEKAAAKAIEEAKVKTAAYTWLLDHGVDDLDNVIYYSHRSVFSFGWSKSLSHDEKSKLLAVLCEFPFEYELN